MKLNTLEHIKQWLKELGVPCTDEEVLQLVVRDLYEETEGNIEYLLLKIDTIKKKEAKKKEILYKNAFWGIYPTLFKHKKSLTKNNIGFWIGFMRAAFPLPLDQHLCKNEVNLFNYLVSIIKSDCSSYLEYGNANCRWAKDCGHYEYIKKVYEL